MKNPPQARTTIGWEDNLISGSLSKSPKRLKLKELLNSQVDTNYEEKILAKKLM